MLYYGNYTDSIGLIRIDKELSISNSINIGEVSAGESRQAGGVVGRLYNIINSGGSKLYGHNTSFNIVNCSNKGNMQSGGYGSAGIVGYIDNAMSYSGIDSKAKADTVKNELVVKYCFNTGDLTGVNNFSGIVGWVYNYAGTNGYDGTTNPIRGGKSSVSISHNRNDGSIASDMSTAGGIIMGLDNYVYSDNCYVDCQVFNNFNTGSANDKGTLYYAGGILGHLRVVGDYANSDKLNILVESNYNYSVDIMGGGQNFQGGIFGSFYQTTIASRITLSNNYSAYKKILGTNFSPPNGANVGERDKNLN